MKIGLLVTSIGNFGQAGFYQSQEIGLARALAPLVDEVKVYKLVPLGQERRMEPVGENAGVLCLPSRQFGINGVPDMAALDKGLDALVYFSDTQLAVPRVCRWARENRVRLFPYIGVTESHSGNWAKRFLVNRLFRRNVRVYRKCRCLAKTPPVKSELERLGIGDVTLAPAGLDLSAMNPAYRGCAPEKLKEKFGYGPGDRVVLFIGRLVEEKRPLQMVEIFSEVSRADPSYRLLMVGAGELRGRVLRAVGERGLADRARVMEGVPNKDVWELYRLADCFVNLNRQEIFGMAILEAMYYECRVIAWEAPGPGFIIEDGVSGRLVGDNAQAIAGILKAGPTGGAARRRVLENFTWDRVARKVEAMVRSDG